MSSATALMRASWLTMTSYRLRMVMSMIALVVSVIPLYFVADALQATMAESIKNQGGQYFGFVIAGMVAMQIVNPAIRTLPAQIASGITRGTLEALLATPARLSSILLGLTAMPLLWSLVSVAILLIAAWALGAQLVWSQAFPSLFILALLLTTYLPFGLMAASLVLVFRTPGPIPQGVMYLSILLGGVYYPTEVIPSWIHHISQWIPMTYGLRSFRSVLLDGQPLSSVSGDIGILLLFSVALFSIGVAAFSLAFRHAKISGTLSQY
ncbi:ABC transporter permease [Myxococcota bacterium]|nr:ABC transporter permease [Myxococcota bacterium]